MSEEFIIRIIDDAKQSISGITGGSTGKTTSKGGGGSGGSLISGMAKLVGIGSIALELFKMASSAIDTIFKPVKTILNSIFKLVSQLLRPIADVLILILQPILLFIKPIIKVFNDIMRPFRTLAYSLMKQGGEVGGAAGLALQQLAMTTIMTGLVNALMGVFAELMKQSFNMVALLIEQIVLFPLLELMRPMLEFFGANVDEIKNNIHNSILNAQQVVSTSLDETMGLIQSKSLQGILEIADGIISTGTTGATLEGARDKLQNAALKAINTASETVKTGLQTAINNMFDITIPSSSSNASRVRSSISSKYDVSNYVPVNTKAQGGYYQFG